MKKGAEADQSWDEMEQNAVPIAHRSEHFIDRTYCTVRNCTFFFHIHVSVQSAGGVWSNKRCSDVLPADMQYLRPSRSR